MVLEAYELPKYLGILMGDISATSDEAYRELVEYFFAFFRDKLSNRNWGNTFSLNPDNRIDVVVFSQGLRPEQVSEVWAPLRAWLKQAPDKYKIKTDYLPIPPQKLWDLNYWEKHHPELVVRNTGKNARPGEYWWKPNTSLVNSYMYAYQSWWLASMRLDSKNLKETAKLFFDASRFEEVLLFINKALAGGSPEAIARTRKTSTNPKVYDAAALVMMRTRTDDVRFDKDGRPLLSNQVKEEIRGVGEGMKLIVGMAPDAGTYVNESDYFLKNWQHAYWGEYYERLLNIKQQYDPQGLFYCHNCVGSEYWSADGMCRQK